MGPQSHVRGSGDAELERSAAAIWCASCTSGTCSTRPAGAVFVLRTSSLLSVMPESP